MNVRRLDAPTTAPKPELEQAMRHGEEDPMNRRQLFLSTAKAALASALGGTWLGSRAETAKAQAADSNGAVLARPRPEFHGKIGRTLKDSTPDFPKMFEAPAASPNILLI